MEDRYEIRGKIGQGGLGSVYRGYDLRMNREVAIKRISTAVDDQELLEESTRQLIKEAGALASLQHPHIVTIYDVGSDDDGPYVVMELISGKTLDELIERAPLTWSDFRELAMQTQEALIAAQELNLIHSDLKPSNLMLTWLPSGKFQVKIVDFGLASLTQSQAPHSAEEMDAVFGSVFFMPPELFERQALDARSDLYSMGCVYYQALTGTYPFDGNTGNEVMTAHLHHTVKPLQELRAGIPIWACDWIMWHLNRYPQDRPASSREALSIFLKNDRVPNVPMSLGISKPTAGPPRPRRNIPGANPGATAAANPGTKSPQTVKQGNLAPSGEVPEAAPGTHSAPQALAPPEGFKPSVHTTPQDDLRSSAGTQPATTVPGVHRPRGASTKAGAPAAPSGPPPHVKRAMMISSAVIIVILALLGLKFWSSHQAKQLITDLLARADTPEASAISISGSTVDDLLEQLAKPDPDFTASRIANLLSVASASDGGDLDTRIATFATQNAKLSTENRDLLIGTVLVKRKNPVVAPLMMQFVATATEPSLQVSALQVLRNFPNDEQFPAMLKIIESTQQMELRDAAELNIEAILKQSANPAELTKQLVAAKDSALKPEVRSTLQRLVTTSNSLKPTTPR